MPKPVLFMRAFLAALVAGSATSGLAQSDEDADWRMAQTRGTPDAYFLYLQRYPRGAYVEEALTVLRERNVLRAGIVTQMRSISLY
ncbi:MAG: hypothetical protein AAGA70_11010 [Pseudomonadota bacterium]